MAAFLLAAMSGGALACRSEESQKPSPQAAASPTTSRAERPTVTRITKDDCAKWADHATEIAVGGFVDAARDCPANVREKVREQFDAQRATIRAGAFDLCSTHLDERYQPEGAQCFMAATAPRTIVDCRFPPMTNASDSDWVAMVDQLRRKCVLPQAPSSAAPRGGQTL